MRKLSNILVTGGAGFIGSNFIRYLFQQTEFEGKAVNVDKLTYAGNIENLIDITDEHEGDRYFFEQVDICEGNALEHIFNEYEIDTVVHFAAESHVDRSIIGPAEFIHTNIFGTFSLLEIARKYWRGRDDVLFHHVSTDEVYGSLDKSGYFYETTSYDPHSPYAASKASSDHLVKSYYYTYKLPITLSNCSNNFGPFQFPEKLIPLMILNLIDEKPLPVYGDGGNVRDWLFVADHASAVWLIMNRGKGGETYNIGGENEWDNITLVNKLCELMAHEKDKAGDYYKKLITFVKDRPGHDRRYAINCDKIKKDLGWSQSVDFAEGLSRTIKWYLENDRWVKNILSGDYQKWIDRNYGDRNK
jgi:dTDP-glucose 4,6-dehydratase